ncbi:interleukin-21 receptor-like isoform X2 [Sphaeramia orbicularis]|uniref:Interleukin-21 receptor-like n=1 Tax=Sphaeramia orbicularis TaxID=375764 RepID=A0A673C9B5_9TELE|nr:interleukin-21 receptor-like isoform X2 [Sphaeramia orbicularis]
MDLSSAQRLNLLIIIILLTSHSIVYPDGVKHGLRCVNDFLSIINCSVLNLTPSGNTSDTDSPFWLIITDEIDYFECILSKANKDYFCSVNTMPNQHPDIPFMDTDEYEISLCHSKSNGSESCKLLEASYKPVENIKPNPPCCLTFYHNLSQHHFAWKSTYEEYSSYTGLVDNLMYQLRYYRTGDKHNATAHVINTESTDFSMDDNKLLPDTEYAAKLRSSPNQVSYKGQWSDWSSEVHWRTVPAMKDDDQTNAFALELVMTFIPFCVILPVVLFLCFVPLKRWRQRVFIPTPEPYFQTLYSDCHGDFKSWVVMQANPTDMLKTEETLQIDTLTKCAEEEECCPPLFPHRYLSEGSTYSNLMEPMSCDTGLPGVPYAVSSLQSTSFSSDSFNPTEGDSGCWLCSDQSLEQSPSWYCNEYCTLSSFQQCGMVPAHHHHGDPAVKPPPQMITGEDIIEETQGLCVYKDEGIV